MAIDNIDQRILKAKMRTAGYTGEFPIAVSEGSETIRLPRNDGRKAVTVPSLPGPVEKDMRGRIGDEHRMPDTSMESTPDNSVKVGSLVVFHYDDGGFFETSRRNVRPARVASSPATIARPAVGNNKLRHETLQNFMLANDSATIAIEIPIWITEQDIAVLENQHGIELAPRVGAAERSITGHIDFLQVRNGAVHILDYKPDARTNKPIAQLAIYALALTRLVPGLKLFDIKCAWFNEEEYCEFFPRTLFANKAG